MALQFARHVGVISRGLLDRFHDRLATTEQSCEENLRRGKGRNFRFWVRFTVFGQLAAPEGLVRLSRRRV